jgi:hypothetical protein
MSAVHFIGCVQFPSLLFAARLRFEGVLSEVESLISASDEGRIPLDVKAQQYAEFNNGQTIEAYLTPLVLLLAPLMMMLLMYGVLLQKSIGPLKTLVYDQLRKRAADTAFHRSDFVDPEQKAVNANARKK